MELYQKSLPLQQSEHIKTPTVLRLTYASKPLNLLSRISCQNEGLLLFWVFRQLYAGANAESSSTAVLNYREFLSIYLVVVSISE